MIPNSHITIVLIDDHSIVREGLRALLELVSDFKIVGEAKNGREAIELVSKTHPMVVVMDIAMPMLNGFEATRQIMKADPNAKVLILSAYSDTEYVEHMVALGASGYLIKQNSGRVLAHAIREISKGKPYFNVPLSKKLKKNGKKSDDNCAPIIEPKVPLTSREAEVLQLVAEGMANKQVASELGISIKTVEKHRQKLMDKLGIHETAGLTRYAIATGVVDQSIQISIL